ncbi:permease [Mycolicibacterium aubagnense]
MGTVTVSSSTTAERVASGLRPRPMQVLVFGIVVFAAASRWLHTFASSHPNLATAGTVFSGVFVQAVPFLVFGVVVSGLIAAFVPTERLSRWLPKHEGAAVLVAAAGGAMLPGCECGSVPVARRVFGEGALGAAALTFMLAAPAINPVVLVATAVAFPGQPMMVVARGAASLLTALTMGVLWVRLGRPEWVTRGLSHEHAAPGESRWVAFTEAARRDFLHAAGYLTVGATAAAVLHVVVPPWVFEGLAGHVALGIVTMGLLAVVLALCSEADAFVASSLSMVPLLPRLVFLVVGPVVDVKLIAMHVGMFGRSFAIRFAPLAFLVAVASASVVGGALLGGVR